MTRKMKRLINKFWFGPVVILAVSLVIWIIHMIPMFVDYLDVVQRLQRIGVQTSKWSIVWLLCLIGTVYIVSESIQEIAWKISSKLSYNLGKQRRVRQDLIDIDQEERILRRVFFEEIIEDFQIDDEEGLWEILKDMTINQMSEAREERKQILYEMEEAQKKGDMGLN